MRAHLCYHGAAITSFQMERHFLVIFFVVVGYTSVLVSMCPTGLLQPSLEPPAGQYDNGVDYPCGRNPDWIPYKDESCLVVLNVENDEEELKSKENAEIACSTFERGYIGDGDAPRLVDIKTEEKQKYIVNFLFDWSVVDPIWLGLAMTEDGVMQWNDGSGLYFSELPQEVPVDQNLRCVEMEAKTGRWIMADCHKGNLVVCEKTQRWSTPRLLNSMINLRLQLERRDSEINKQITNLNNRLTTQSASSSLQGELKALSENPVPIGFTYFQLPYQAEPSIIWPQVTWREVSDWYAGDFFRVVGGDADEFGQEQSGNSPRLEKVESVSEAQNKWFETSIKSDGSWSDAVTLGWRSDGNLWRGLRFRTSLAEVRPVNMAIKVWQRLK